MAACSCGPNGARRLSCFPLPCSLVCSSPPSIHASSTIHHIHNTPSFARACACVRRLTTGHTGIFSSLSPHHHHRRRDPRCVVCFQLVCLLAYPRPAAATTTTIHQHQTPMLSRSLPVARRSVIALRNPSPVLPIRNLVKRRVHSQSSQAPVGRLMSTRSCGRLLKLPCMYLPMYTVHLKYAVHGYSTLHHNLRGRHQAAVQTWPLS
ncbi:unnamed protein product [Periconia digitata]|uniref:Uncharacterized protein n=1 Tax=Periconia digitata TaxID=1303443 RepID=A0A9W4UIJ6_9PLEO|nr:unnamed protein product [Periconia digitata]